MQRIAHSELWLTSRKRPVAARKASSDHDDIEEPDLGLSAHMVNLRKDARDTLHALLATYVHRPGID
jgi:hypothetical protein